MIRLGTRFGRTLTIVTDTDTYTCTTTAYISRSQSSCGKNEVITRPCSEHHNIEMLKIVQSGARIIKTWAFIIERMGAYTHFVGLIEIPGSTGCHSLPSGDAA